MSPAADFFRANAAAEPIRRIAVHHDKKENLRGIRRFRRNMTMDRKYRRLAAEKIIETINQTEVRIRATLGERGLAQVCNELGTMATDAKRRASALQQPIWVLRLIPLFVIIFLAIVGWQLRESYSRLVLSRDVAQLSAAVQQLLRDIAVPAAITLPIPFIWAGISFMTSLESRWKRYKALRYLHELRSIIHVIDMHQLTKDPHQLADGLAGDELVLYLENCSELLSLSSKIAALYAESSHDPVVIETVSDLSQLTSNLSNKIWQKINIMERKMPVVRATASPERRTFLP